MATKQNLVNWVELALGELGGRGSIVQVAEIIWREHRKELEASGNLFFTWQYDMRWAATTLRKAGRIKSKDISPKGIWELT
ncbi:MULTISPECIES: hypothetical protein [Vibrio]|uniref:hypothetical protein n=1 Tax=Vibrio TaxID=662 RepID=UPI003967603F